MGTREQLSEKYREDCFALHCCFSGNNSSIDLRKVVDIISHRNAEELELIRRSFQDHYKQNIIDVLSQKNDLFWRMVYLRLSKSSDRDAEIIGKAIYGNGTDLRLIIEIICTRSSSELPSIKQSYHGKYTSLLEQDVSTKTSGCLKEILLAILNSTTYNIGRVDTSMAMCDAKTLYEAIESGKSIDQKAIIYMLSQRSSGQMKAVLSAFKQLYGHEFMKFLKKEKCGEFGTQLRAPMLCIQFPEKHFARQLCRASANGDLKKVLIRIVVTRCGIDIRNIDSAFAVKTGRSLENLIRSEFSSSSSSNRYESTVGVIGDALISLSKHS